MPPTPYSTHTQTDRQTDKHTHTHTDRQTDTHTHTDTHKGTNLRVDGVGHIPQLESSHKQSSCRELASRVVLLGKHPERNQHLTK